MTTMYCLTDRFTSPAGDALPGYFVRLLDKTTGAIVAIYADENSTPIVSVSGVANAAKQDADGNHTLFVAHGVYSVEYLNEALVRVAFRRYVNCAGDPDAAVDAEAARDEAVAAAANAEAAAVSAAADAASINGDVAAAAASAAAAAGSATSAAGSATSAGNSATSASASAATATTQAGIATAAANQAVSAVENYQTFKSLVDLATTTPLTAQSGTPVIDGVQTVAGMRVLDWNNPDATKRGVYVVAAGTWARSADADDAAKLSGMNCIVVSGSTHFGRQFNCVTSIATLGTDSITFVPEFYAPANPIQAMARQRTGVNAHVGDSNTVGRNGTHFAYMRGRGHPYHGPWRDWTHYDFADSGMKAAAIAATISTGDRNAVPVDYQPAQNPGFGTPVGSGGGGGNIWMIINALNQSSNAICEISLGINDFGLAPRGTGTDGDPEVFKRNMRNIIMLILACTRAQILLRIPQPFGGEDFIQASVNYTDWAAGPPVGTVDANAALYSGYMIAAYREWMGRNPRVHVFDAPKLVYGADRCDDTATDCLDAQVGATFNGSAVSSSLRRLIADALHSSELGERREEEGVMRFLGLDSAKPSVSHNLIIGTRFPFKDAVDAEVLHFESLSTSGSDTILRLRASPEHLAWRAKQEQILLGTAGYYRPALDALAQGEQYVLTKRIGAIQRLLNWRSQIKFWFPATGNTYTSTDVRLSTVVTDTDSFSEQYINLLVKGVVMTTEQAAADGPDIGFSGTSQLDQSQQLCIAYIDELDNSHQARWQMPVTVVGTLGSSPTIMTDIYSDYRIARTFRCTRTDNSPTTPTLTVSVANQGDGRLIDGSINFGTGEGMPIGTFTFSSGIRVGTWTPNTTNIDAAIAAGIGWKGVAGSNWVTLKHDYYIRVKADSALGNPACVVISN